MLLKSFSYKLSSIINRFCLGFQTDTHRKNDDDGDQSHDDDKDKKYNDNQSNGDICMFQGAAVKQSTSGEVEERNYVDGKLNGKVNVSSQIQGQIWLKTQINTNTNIVDG